MNRNRLHSVSQLVRDFLARLFRKADGQRAAIAQLDQMFRTSRVHVGRRTWTREDLHER